MKPVLFTFIFLILAVPVGHAACVFNTDEHLPPGRLDRAQEDAAIWAHLSHQAGCAVTPMAPIWQGPHALRTQEWRDMQAITYEHRIDHGHGVARTLLGVCYRSRATGKNECRRFDLAEGPTRQEEGVERVCEEYTGAEAVRVAQAWIEEGAQAGVNAGGGRDPVCFGFVRQTLNERVDDHFRLRGRVTRECSFRVISDRIMTSVGDACSTSPRLRVPLSEMPRVLTRIGGGRCVVCRY